MPEGTLVDAEILDVEFPYHAYDFLVLSLTQGVEFLGFAFHMSSHSFDHKLGF